MKKIYAMAVLVTVLTAWTETFQVSPGNGSFGNAAKNWKPGDTVISLRGNIRARFAVVTKDNRATAD